MPAIGAGEHVADRPVVDHVPVAFSHRVADGVKTLGHVVGLQHGHVARQLGVKRPLQYVGRQTVLGPKTDDLPQRVYAGVGTAAGDGADTLAGDLLQRRLQHALHRFSPRLDLPAGVGGTVIGQDELDGSHGRAGDAKCPRGTQPAGVVDLPMLNVDRRPLLRYALSASSSAICTALVAAPLRRLSLTHQKARPLGLERSSRIRPMNTSSRRSQLIGIG